MRALSRKQEDWESMGEGTANRLGLRMQSGETAWKRGSSSPGLLLPLAFYRSGLVRLGLSSSTRRPRRAAPALRVVRRRPASPRPAASRCQAGASVSQAEPREKPAPGRFLVKALLAVTLAVLLLNLALAGGAVWLWKHPQSLAALLPGAHVNLKKAMDITVAGPLPLKTHFSYNFPVKLDTNIPIRVPVSDVLRVPINETFEVPIEKELSVSLDQPVHVKDVVRVRANVALDTTVQAKVMGVTMNVPVKGTIPLDFNLPLDQDLGIRGDVKVNLAETLPIHIRHQVNAPIDFVVKGSIPLHQELNVPIDADLDCLVNIPESFPIRMDLDLSTADVGSKVRFSGGE